MNTIQINELLSEYDCFIGTYPRDLLPIKKIKIRPCALIINTDDSSKPGEHWVSIYMDVSGTAEYFDSFGFMPMHDEIYNFLYRNKITNLIYNPNQIQSITSKTCGAYCVIC
jgi:Adenovirus endoprotease